MSSIDSQKYKGESAPNRRDFLAAATAGFCLLCTSAPTAIAAPSPAPQLDNKALLIKSPAFHLITQENQTRLETRGKDQSIISYETDARGAFVIQNLPSVEAFYQGKHITLESLITNVHKQFPQDDPAAQQKALFNFTQNLIKTGIAFTTTQHVYCIHTIKHAS